MNSIIILNWNTSDLVINLLKSMIQNTSSLMEVIVVDNGSKVDETKKLTDFFDSTKCDSILLKLSFLEKNIGFGAGNNVALNQVFTDAKNVIFINSDILIEEKDWDLKFNKILEPKDIAIVGCAYHPLTWDKNANFKIHPKVAEPVASETVQGAFFAIKKSVLDKIKIEDGCWFDENFKFAQYEETDLQLRIIERGFKCVWFSCAHQHLHNSSATKKNGYNLSEDIKNINEFKANAEKNKQLLIKKHKTFFESK